MTEYGFARIHNLPNAYLGLHALGKIHVKTRTESNKTEAFRRGKRIAFLHKRNYSLRHETRNLRNAVPKPVRRLNEIIATLVILEALSRDALKNFPGTYTFFTILPACGKRFT